MAKTSTSAHIYLQSAVHVFTPSGIYGVFAVTLIWSVAKLLATALVSSSLNCCNSFFSGIAETDLIKLQRILIRLTRVVTKSPRFTHSVSLLRSLHWLPVHFKICLLTYKALHEEQPVYLCSFIVISLLLRSLRSNKRNHSVHP